jgi:lysyl-tRNA synthetase class 2
MKDQEENLIQAHTAHEEDQIRREKAAELNALGIDPWPEYRAVGTHIKSLHPHFATVTGEPTDEQFSIAGRIMAKRDHGKTIFCTLHDGTGTIQIYLKQAVLESSFKTFEKLIDIGDIIWVEGALFKTRAGEPTIAVKAWTILSKCLHPLPEKFHGLTDIELRYRQRSLDIMTNNETRQRFINRSHIIQAIRSFLIEKDFLEVETPMLHPIPGGAIARPFVTHHNAYDIDLFLRIAPELYLKRLVVGGLERVFEINRNFRNEGVSTKHNPEFTMLEFYLAHGDYHIGMQLTQELMRTAAARIAPSMCLPFGDQIIDFGKPYAQMTVEESLSTIGGLTKDDLTPSQIDTTLQRHGCATQAQASQGEKLYALFEAAVEEKIVQPTFIIGYPIEVSPLAKKDPDDPSRAARFELFVMGMELANGYTELNDPIDQDTRLKNQAQTRSGGDDEAHYYDAAFVKALEYGLPPTVGVGIGIDRLIMLLTNTTTIKDVILFPTMKPGE